MMKDLLIQGTNKTPTVDFRLSGDIRIEGRSIPEDSQEFYRPIITWIKALNENLPTELNVHVKLEYINTSSSKILLELFKLLDQIHSSGKARVKVTWLYDYDDDDSREEGNNYKSEVDLPFTIIPL
jgi:hypothetical protein